MRVLCESCGHAHEVDAGTIPLYGARVRCAGCGRLIPLAARDSHVHGAEPSPVTCENGQSLNMLNIKEIHAESRVDSDQDAVRLARGLLTDVVYADPPRFAAARRQGRVLAEYVDEIGRAYAFYRRRVGTETPGSSLHFRRALREILGGPTDAPGRTDA